MRSTSSPIYLGELNETPVGDLRSRPQTLAWSPLNGLNSSPDLMPIYRLERLIQPDFRLMLPTQISLRISGGPTPAVYIPDRLDLIPSVSKGSPYKAMFKIPYSETRTLPEIAIQIASPMPTRSGACQCDKPHADGHSLSSRHRDRWQTAWLWRRRGIADKGVAAQDGRGDDRVTIQNYNAS